MHCKVARGDIAKGQRFGVIRKMKKYKVLAAVFILIGLTLSHVMCAYVAFTYCDMLWGIKYEGWSAPADAAFLLAIPYLLGTIAAFAAAFALWRKSKKI